MFARLARMLGVEAHQLDDALQSEKRAKAQLSRRGLLLAGAAGLSSAILPGKTWSFASPARNYLVIAGGLRVHADFWRILTAQTPLFSGMR